MAGPPAPAGSHGLVLPELTASGDALRFGSATGGRRSEDGPLLTGRGRFTDDVDLPGQVHAAFARSAAAHGVIRAVDTSRALALPGVLAVLTGLDLAAAGLGAIPPAASGQIGSAEAASARSTSAAAGSGSRSRITRAAASAAWAAVSATAMATASPT